MFENFAADSRRAIVMARDEARALRHDFVDTEHLLLGLLTAGGTATEILTSLGASTEPVRNEILRIIGPYNRSLEGNIPFTRRAKNVIERAVETARKNGHDHVGTGHLLLGLIDDGEGIASQILINMYADLPRVREQAVNSFHSMGLMKNADHWQILCLPSIAETIDENLSLKSSGIGSVCFQMPGNDSHDASDLDITGLVRGVAADGAKSTLSVDSYEFSWLTFQQDPPDLASLAHALRALSVRLLEAGHGAAILCCTSVFSGPGKRRMATVYLNRRGTFYPFAPTAGEHRDRSLEIDFKRITENKIPIETDFSRWFPIWDAPGLPLDRSLAHSWRCPWLT